MEPVNRMEIKIVDITEEQVDEIESKLRAYDETYITYKLEGSIHIGARIGDNIIGGLDACMTAFKILYVSTVFVEESYRQHGIGRRLMEEMERRAVSLGANMIRLDTFDWQGKEFYQTLGYEQVGFYENPVDGFCEYFFLKRL